MTQQEQPKKIIVAIDGHSSCGKSTMAKWLAKEVGYTYIDTGAMFRAVTLYTIENGLWKNGEPSKEAVANVLDKIKIAFDPSNGHTLLNDKDVEKEIRGMEVSGKVSYISTLPEVRTLLLNQQREMGKQKGIVMDGRDIGTAVFPNAELKIFVTAPAEIRAERRYKELTGKGEKVTFEEILINVTERDRIDSSREIAPLKAAEDAIIFDNSNYNIEQQNVKIKEFFDEAIS